MDAIDNLYFGYRKVCAIIKALNHEHPQTETTKQTTNTKETHHEYQDIVYRRSGSSSRRSDSSGDWARYGGEFAGLLRVDVLTGIAVVATLVALIILEYGRGTARAVRQPAVLRSMRSVNVSTQGTKIVALSKDEDTRAAA